MCVSTVATVLPPDFILYTPLSYGLLSTVTFILLPDDILFASSLTIFGVPGEAVTLGEDELELRLLEDE